MQPHASERRYLERQIAYARPIFLVLALVDLFEEPSSLRGHHAVGFIAAYLGVSLLLAALDKVHGVSMPSPPLAADIIALSVFLLLTPSVIAFLFVYLFVALAAGTRWGLHRTVVLAGAATLALLVRAALRGPVGWPSVVSLLALTVGTFSAGIGLAYMGDRDRRHAAEHELLARLSSLMNVDTGVTESLRRVLDELARNFDCAVAFLVFRDAEIERIFLWAVRPGDEGRLSPENLRFIAATVSCSTRPTSRCVGIHSKARATDSVGIGAMVGQYKPCLAFPARPQRSSDCGRCSA